MSRENQDLQRIFLQCSTSCGLSRESQARVKSSGTNLTAPASVDIRLRVVRSYFPANNIINQQKSECFTQITCFSTVLNGAEDGRVPGRATSFIFRSPETKC